MACNHPSRCCETPAEHYRSLAVAHPERRSWTKTTTDDHGTHQVDVTQHWHDRQDVLVKGVPTARAVVDRNTGKVENVSD